MTESADILVNIPDDDLPLLANMYRSHQNLCPYVYNAIMVVLKWRKSGYSDCLKIASPKNSWKEDGTIFFFAQFKPDWMDLLIFTLDRGTNNIYKALMLTNKLSINGTVQFYSIHSTMESIILQAIKDRGWSLKSIEKGTTYSVSVEKALSYEIKLPEEIQIKKLNADVVKQINDIWPQRHPGSEEYISNLIEKNGGFGVFLKENDELVAWTLINHVGMLGALQVADGYQRNGYGSLITKYLSREKAKMGLKPTGDVVLENKSAEELFEKLGFENIDMCVYIEIVPNIVT